MAKNLDYIDWKKEGKHSFENYNLIMPDISIGNVGQLAIDLLLNNLKIQHIGRIDHPCVRPFIGYDPFSNQNKLVSSWEIYEYKEKKLVIFQIRSFVFPNQFLTFKNIVLDFFKQLNFKQLTVLASSSSEYFSASQLQGIPLHYLCTSKFPEKEAIDQLKWKEFSLPESVVVEKSIPGCLASSDLLGLCEEDSIPMIALICVCSEGDNYPEAFQVVGCLNSWLNLKQVKGNAADTWKKPASWNLPYGNVHPLSLY